MPNELELGSDDASRIVVIGAGLLGVASAYELAARGERVLVLERHEDIAAETSYANGGMLTASMPDPWNNPGVGRHLLSSLFDPRSAMKLRLHAVPGLVPWGLQFLRNSTPSRHAHATLANYRLAAYSVSHTTELSARLGLAYDSAETGVMKVFESLHAMEASETVARRLKEAGLRYTVLDRAGAINAEPQLADVAEKIAGALFYPDDRSGDARLFVQSLAAKARAAGVELRTGVTVSRIACEGANVTGVVVNGRLVRARLVVIASGIAAPALARACGVRLSIAPAKGYSLTLDASSLAQDMPRLPVIDDAMHAAVVPLGNRLRLVGTAEFTGHNTRIAPERIDNLFALFSRLFPHLAKRVDRTSGTAWAGLRPMSADGRPFIGRTPVRGLWLNCGHGHLGWTKAVGSARLLADLILSRAPEIDASPFAYGAERSLPTK